MAELVFAPSSLFRELKLESCRWRPRLALLLLYCVSSFSKSVIYPEVQTNGSFKHFFTLIVIYYCIDTIFVDKYINGCIYV